MDAFDDFGADVNPVPVAILTSSELEFHNNKCGIGVKENLTGFRY